MSRAKRNQSALCHASLRVFLSLASFLPAGTAYLKLLTLPPCPTVLSAAPVKTLTWPQPGLTSACAECAWPHSCPLTTFSMPHVSSPLCPSLLGFGQGRTRHSWHPVFEGRQMLLPQRGVVLQKNSWKSLLLAARGRENAFFLAGQSLK